MTSLPLRLRAMLIAEKYTDCSFIVDNGTWINGHKIVLAAASPVFEAMFYGPFSQQNKVYTGQGVVGQHPEEDAVRIVDVSAKIFRSMLDYVYTDQIDWSSLTNYDLLELYYCVEKYLIPKEDILHRIRSSLNCNSLFLFYDFAVRFKVPLLLADCRQMLADLLEKKPNLFFKKVLQVNCDQVIRDYEEDISEDAVNMSEGAPAVKRKPRVPIEFIEDIVFGGAALDNNEPIAQYHQVSKECLNDMLVLNYDDANGTYNENLLLFVLKWTKIEWKLEIKGQDKLPLQKLALHNYFKSFVCHKRVVPLVENMIVFLENHCHLNTVENVSGWHLLQRVDLKASRPLHISSSSSEPTQFVTKFQVNHLLTIKSFIINSRLNNAILSRFMRSTISTTRHFVYKENVTIEISASDSTERDPITIHRQQFNAETEFNTQCELFLNKCLYFCPDQVYTLRFMWPQGTALAIEYPRKIYERCQSMSLANKHLSIVFMDDAKEGNTVASSKDNNVDVISGGILSGLQLMFVS